MDLKISQLPVLDGVDIATDDVMPIVDTSADVTKKVSMAALDARFGGGGGSGITDLTGDVLATGPGSAVAAVAFVGGASSAAVASAATLAAAATASNTANAIVKRNASGNFTAGVITAALNGNANTATFATSSSSATTATNFTGPLAGDVSGTQGATQVDSVGGKTAANVATSVTDTQDATAANTASKIAKRDSNGDCAFRNIDLAGFEDLAEAAAPAAPAAGKIRLYGAPGGILFLKDSSGTITQLGGGTPLGLVPIGAVVPTFPNLSGAYNCTATTVADAYGYVKCNGQTLSDVTSVMNGQVIPNINNSIFLLGSTTAGSTGGSSTISTSNLPAHTHTFSGTASSSSISGTAAGQSWSGSVSGGSYNIGAAITLGALTNSALTNGGGPFFVGDNYVRGPESNPSVSGSNSSSSVSGTAAGQAFSGTTGNGPGSGATFLPPYISSVYCMRVK